MVDRPKVLLISDNTKRSERFAGPLKRAGFEIIQAQTRLEVESSIAAKVYTAVLVDSEVRFPKFSDLKRSTMAGLYWAHHISRAFPEVPIVELGGPVSLTGRTLDHIRTDHLHAGHRYGSVSIIDPFEVVRVTRLLIASSPDVSKALQNS